MSNINAFIFNKVASLCYDSLKLCTATIWLLTGVKCRATSVARKYDHISKSALTLGTQILHTKPKNHYIFGNFGSKVTKTNLRRGDMVHWYFHIFSVSSPASPPTPAPPSILFPLKYILLFFNSDKYIWKFGQKHRYLLKPHHPPCFPLHPTVQPSFEYILKFGRIHFEN